VKLVAVALVTAAVGLAGAARTSDAAVHAAGERSSSTVASAPGQIDAQEAWPLLENRHVPPVAVLDTGIDDTQPLLAGKVAAARDFVDATGDTTDASWHGTAVAGVIAADDPNSTCPRCTLVSGKVLDAQESGTDAEIASGLRWAVGAGARVVNLSMAGATEAPALRAAIRSAVAQGVVVVAAAGNDGTTARSYPAADPNVIGVAATTSSDSLFSWSNRGSWIAIAAPGQVTTTLRGGGFTTFRGTSAAAPAVAAAAAECLAVAPTLSPVAVRRILTSTAAPVAGEPFGRLDVGRAVQACAAA
jgi:thermitase